MIILDKFNRRHNIKYIFFDIDGTLTRWINVESFLESSCEGIGLPYKKEYLPLLFKAIRMNELHAIVTGKLSETDYEQFLSSYIDDLKQLSLTGKDLKNKMFELEASQTFISGGVHKELTKLKQEYYLYCYTNWFYNQAIKKLDYHDLTNYFEKVYSPEQICPKHSKESYEYLLRELNINPENVLFIGDSEVDIIPSSEAGIKTIYINYNLNLKNIKDDEMKLIERADASITDFSDIHVVLAKRAKTIAFKKNLNIINL